MGDNVKGLNKGIKEFQRVPWPPISAGCELTAPTAIPPAQAEVAPALKQNMIKVKQAKPQKIGE